MVKKKFKSNTRKQTFTINLSRSAWGATRKKDSYFKNKYQKLVVRKGSKKAVVAIAHKVIIAVYHVLP